MLIGAVSGYGAAVATGNLWLALLAAAGAGAAFGMLHAFLTVSLRVNQIAVGLTLVFLGTGLSGYAGQAIAGAPVVESFPIIALPGLSGLPVIGSVLFDQDVVAYGTVLLGLLVWAMLRHSALGLNLRAVGEDPAAADTAGVPVALYRYAAVLAGGALAGVAGAYFAVAVAHAWAEQITGRPRLDRPSPGHRRQLAPAAADPVRAAVRRGGEPQLCYPGNRFGLPQLDPADAALRFYAGRARAQRGPPAWRGRPRAYGTRPAV